MRRTIPGYYACTLRSWHVDDGMLHSIAYFAVVKAILARLGRKPAVVLCRLAKEWTNGYVEVTYSGMAKRAGKKITVGFVALGCPKNVVDSERMLAQIV